MGAHFDPFMPTVPTFAVRETDVSRTANVGTVSKNWLRKCNGGQECYNSASNMRKIALHLIFWSERGKTGGGRGGGYPFNFIGWAKKIL